MELTRIRNFSIIAHIDHGKSTLADRFLEKARFKMNQSEQALDSMELERERGITIKLKPVALSISVDGNDYVFNLIDTPGHVDFSYEVSRSLAACEGALLLVDATKGIQAQTIANYEKALEEKLAIIPVINKIDAPNADIEGTVEEVTTALGFKKDEIVHVSAKTGENIEELLRAVVNRIPSPGLDGSVFKSLIFDSFFDTYQGAIAVVRVFGGRVKSEDSLILMNTGVRFRAGELGVFAPEKTKKEVLDRGSVGYIVTGQKDVGFVKVGDTLADERCDTPLPGYREPQRVIFKGIYPVEGNDFENLRLALSKLNLQDSSFSFEPESSGILGQGFICGFLGGLHSEIIEARIEREFDIDVYTTYPTVKYKRENGEEIIRPSQMSFPTEDLLEPWVYVRILVLDKFIGGIMKMMEEYRSEFVDMKYLGRTEGKTKRVSITYNLPLSQMVADFFGNLKSVSSGFASLDYRLVESRKVKVCKLDVLIAKETVEPLSRIVPESEVESSARKLTAKLKDVIPKQQFAISVQAAVGGKILAREDISAYRKDVTQKLYGGDKTRRDKLLEKQKKGKKRLRRFGRVDISPGVFREVSTLT